MATATATLLDARRSQRRGQAFVALAAVAWSTAGVLQRGVSAGPAAQVGVRAVFAGLALLAFVAVAERGRVARAFRSAGGAGIGVALALAGASASFIIALNHTTVAHVLFIQAMSPVLAALLARVTLGEPVSARTALAMTVALAGVAVMVGGPGGGDTLGNVLSLSMALCFAVAIVITRHRRDVSMAPATCLAQVVLMAVFLPFAHPADVPAEDVLALAALGAGQIGLGLAFLTIGARLIPAAQVALISLLEVVLGPLWVWMAIDERPSTATLAGGAVVVAAVVLQARAGAPPAAEPIAQAGARPVR